MRQFSYGKKKTETNSASLLKIDLDSLYVYKVFLQLAAAQCKSQCMQVERLCV